GVAGHCTLMSKLADALRPAAAPRTETRTPLTGLLGRMFRSVRTVAFAPAAMGGASTATPVGRPSKATAMASANPAARVAVTVTVAVAAGASVSDAGVTARVNDASGPAPGCWEEQATASNRTGTTRCMDGKMNRPARLFPFE